MTTENPDAVALLREAFDAIVDVPPDMPVAVTRAKVDEHPCRCRACGCANRTVNADVCWLCGRGIHKARSRRVLAVRPRDPQGQEPTMRAITLYQPWASLIADGRKTFETRTWTTTYRGPIAIHAGSMVVAEYAVECGYKPEGLPRGAIVAVARLAGVITTEQAQRTFDDTMPFARAREEFCHGDYSLGRYAWELADVRPVPALWIPGRQGLWDVPPDVEIRLRMDAGLAGR